MKTAQVKRPKGLVLWENSTIVAIATFTSVNRKTGNMIQVWILNKNTNPVEAVRNGEDKNICGECSFRNNGCYVEVWQAPTVIWKNYKAGKYSYNKIYVDDSLFEGRVIRWGAYGDPAFIPLSIVRYFSNIAKGWTGYTHQWHSCNSEFSKYLMASCDSYSDVAEAERKGYRTFRVGFDSLPQEITCPASKELNKTTCENCLLCNGARENDVRKSIKINPHGKQKNKLIQILLAN